MVKMNFDKKINAINKLVKSNVLSENEARLCILALRAHYQNSPSNEISYLKNKTLIYDNQGIKIFYEYFNSDERDYYDDYCGVGIYFSVENSSCDEFWGALIALDITIDGIGFGDYHIFDPRFKCEPVYKNNRKLDNAFVSAKRLVEQGIDHNKIKKVEFKLGICLDVHGCEYDDLNNGRLYTIIV